MSFKSLGLISPIVNAVSDKGYDTPTPIQVKSVPIILQGKDLMASAQTGTGKTAAFVLPLLQKLSEGQQPREKRVHALIVTPTRELAAQIQSNIDDYSRHLKISNCVVFGGVNINPQIRTLKRGVDILVATPGRLLDLQNQGAVSLDSVETLVLDEADRMLDMGFIHDIRRIQKSLPAKKQSLLFSATFSNEIRQLAKTMLQNPVEVDVAPRNTTVESVRQRIHPVDKKQKTGLLQHLILENSWSQVLVFSRTKHGANKLAKNLDKAGIRAAAIHGNKSQANRTRALADFKKGKVTVLVATDIAARGIDISELPHVINFDLPNVPEDYVHRIGRTGRAGANGEAVSLVCADEMKQLKDIERVIGTALIREEIDGFEPDHQLSASGQPQRANPRRKANENGSNSKSGNKPGNRSSSKKPSGNNVKQLDERRRRNNRGGNQGNRNRKRAV